MKKFLLITLSLLFASTLWACKGDNVQNVTVEELPEMLKNDSLQVVDVRSLEEYDNGHLPGAILINVSEDTFDNKVDVVLSKDKPVLVYCRTGVRSSTAAKKLKEKGYNVYNLVGGYNKAKKVL